MSVSTLIMAGGEGRGLSILCEQRAKPAVPFAGQYRIIDFALSNAVNSELNRIAVLVQYQPHSLMEHLGTGEPWNVNYRRASGIRIWPAYRGRNDQGWYRGTADALYQNRSFISDDADDALLILCGDHIYKQDYRDLLRFHREKRADLTIAVTQVSPDDTHRFGMMRLDADQRVRDFAEKPKESQSTLASMGIYVFNPKFLLRRLEEDAKDTSSSHEIGKNMIPTLIERDRVFGYRFDGYWADMGTIAAYWESNLSLLANKPALDLYDSSWMIHTRADQRPPSKCLQPSQIADSMISQGCVVHGTVINSILSPGVQVAEGAIVRDSIIMHDTIIRAGAQIHRSILDKQVVIGAEAQVGAGDDNAPNEREPVNLHAGITVVGQRAQVPAGAIVGRNCLIDPHVTPAEFHQLEVSSGATVSKR
ncbi:MAG: glucose-1-phosphate adenylyltransferase [Acidobacteria bacterium]|nr:glucose-1-phosphate adenylyltransferase [Acidobacteriota bacterium]